MTPAVPVCSSVFKAPVGLQSAAWPRSVVASGACARRAPPRARPADSSWLSSTSPPACSFWGVATRVPLAVVTTGRSPSPAGLRQQHVAALSLQDRKETRHRPHPGRGGRRPRRPRSGLGVLLRAALHLGEPEARPHRLPQEDHPPPQLRPRQDLQAPGPAEGEAGRPQAPVTRTRSPPRATPGDGQALVF